MTDLSQTIAPKSDQLNADDLIGRTKTITITRISRSETPDQPISIFFEGDNGKPYKPCKSMRRVLVQVWGADGLSYVGKSMTLYRDDKVVFGGVAVGGIRISHMSHIDEPKTMALTATKASRKPFTVKPLIINVDEGEGKVPDEIYDKCRLELLAATSMDELKDAWENAQATAKEHRDSNALRGFTVLKDKMKDTINQTATQENE